MRLQDFSLNFPSREMNIGILSIADRVHQGLFEGNDFRYILQPTLAGSERMWGRAEGEHNLGWVLCNFGDGTLIVVGGARRGYNLHKFTAESSIFSLFADNSGINQVVVDLAEEMRSTIINTGIPIAQPVVLGGYSLGGCVCYSLAIKLRLLNYPIHQIFTYGSPRPGGLSAQAEISGYPVKRYYHIADPVRSYPPHYNEAYSVWPFINQATRNRWNAQVQVAGGIGIDDGGVLRESEDVVPENGSIAILSVARHYLGLETLSTGNHSIGNYQRCFAAGIEPVPVNPTYPIRPRAESPAEPTLVQTRRAIEIGVAAQEAEAMVPRPDRVVVTTSQPSSYDNAYRVRHRDGIWTVEIAGFVTDVGPGKRAARRKAKALNRLARS